MDPDPNWRAAPDGLPCPYCGAPTEVGDWWDVPSELGGRMVGELRRCTYSHCGWSQRRR